jgi:hypothetical protein
VAVLIVDLLEAVEVEQDGGQGLGTATGLRGHSLERLVGRATVR